MTALGAGNEAQVYSLDERHGLALKLYKPTVIAELHQPSLLALMNAIDNMDESRRSIVRSRAALPIELVIDRGRWVGFTMPLLPDSFFVKHGVKANPKRVELDWNRLTMSHTWITNPNIYSEVPSPTEQQRLEIALSLAESMSYLHQGRVIVGDISGRNLLWTLSPSPIAYFLDTDSFRLEHLQGTTSPKETEGWRDLTLLGKPTNRSSDLFKMALAISRMFFSSEFGPKTAKAPPPSTTPVSLKIYEMAKRALSSSFRPDAVEWTRLLHDLIREKQLEGRPIISKPPPPPPKGPQTLWEDRPTIVLPPLPPRRT